MNLKPAFFILCVVAWALFCCNGMLMLQGGKKNAGSLEKLWYLGCKCGFINVPACALASCLVLLVVNTVMQDIHGAGHTSL